MQFSNHTASQLGLSLTKISTTVMSQWLRTYAQHLPDSDTEQYTLRTPQCRRLASSVNSNHLAIIPLYRKSPTTPTAITYITKSLCSAPSYAACSHTIFHLQPGQASLAEPTEAEHLSAKSMAVKLTCPG